LNKGKAKEKNSNQKQISATHKLLLSLGPSLHSTKNIAQILFSPICASFVFRTHAMHDGCAAASVPAVVSFPLPLLGAN